MSDLIGADIYVYPRETKLVAFFFTVKVGAASGNYFVKYHGVRAYFNKFNCKS